jgi:GT2 family glycosyltransferase
MSERVRRNDWSGLEVPELGRWRPTLRVSVVVPAYRCQPSLDLALAALSRQTYPTELLEVVVVDDGSRPPLELPPIRPPGTRLVRAPETGWGRAHALHVGAASSAGDILHWLDADMVVHPEHVEAQVRWQHAVPYAVTLGHKLFVDVTPDRPGWPTPEQAATASETLFPVRDGEPHDYIERHIRRTNKLRDGDHLTFLCHVGATAALRRELYEAAGGFDTDLRLGEDTEFGYRLAQAGALFVPEPAARSWHLGRTHVMRAQEQVRRYNRPFLADRMPHPRWLRRTGGTAWSVPLVTVAMDIEGQPLELVRAAVDALLTGDERDLRVCLVGPWNRLTGARLSPLTDPLLSPRLIAATYRGEPRVRLVTEAPQTAFPSPYLIEAPATHGFGTPTVTRLVELADRHQVGLVRVRAGGAETRLWRTAALGRARWVRRDGESLAGVVAEVYGRREATARAVGLIDLSPFAPVDLTAGVAAMARAGARPGRWVPDAVEVAGPRSLARAAAVVAVLAYRRAVNRLGRVVRARTAPVVGGASSPDGQPPGG